MNGKDLLLGLGNISHKYYDEAENEIFVPQTTVRRLRKPLLVAALIALMLLLVGCAVVYALRLQDMSIGKETYIQSFDEQGKAIEPTVRTRDILSIYGHSGDAIQQATAEWFAFRESYDPKGDMATNAPAISEIPDNYEYIYGCYTSDMVAKVDEIAKKYGLKVLENRIPFHGEQIEIFFEETGIGSFVLPESGAGISHVAGMLYEPYNFNMEFLLKTNAVPDNLWCSISYADKAYFPRDYPGGVDLSLYEQWDHTTPSGLPLLLARSSKGHCYIIAEPDNRILVITLNGNFSNSIYPKAEDIITAEQLEAVADMFDYSIQPKRVDRVAVEQRLAEADTQKQLDYVPESYGSFADYLEKSYTVYDDTLQYVFYDMTGDEAQELLIGRDGGYLLWLTEQNGEILARSVRQSYLCEGRVEERFDKFDIYETHMYLAPLNETQIDDLASSRTILTVLWRKEDQWTQGPNDAVQNPITEREAQKVMAQYPRIALDWKPLMDYPLDEAGATLGSQLQEKDVQISQEELHELYRKTLTNDTDSFLTRYRILDINNDGVDDLLRSGGECYWNALTYRYGQLHMLLEGDFYLCENGVLETEYLQRYNGVEVTGHEFFRYNGFEKETLGFTAYNKATATWQSDWYGTAMTEEANAILTKYPRIDQGMRPVAELMK